MRPREGSIPAFPCTDALIQRIRDGPVSDEAVAALEEARKDERRDPTTLRCCPGGLPRTAGLHGRISGPSHRTHRGLATATLPTSVGMTTRVLAARNGGHEEPVCEQEAGEAEQKEKGPGDP